MTDINLKQKAVNASLWALLRVGGNKLIKFIITIFIARLVLPEQYGLVAMISVFLSISSVFIDAGLSEALVRDNKRKAIDCSTVFYCNISVALIFCIGFQYIAPYIADFYGMTELVKLTRVSSLGFIIGAFGNVQKTLISAELQYKRATIINFISTTLSGIIGICLAFRNAQVWALVGQELSYSAISTMLYWIKSDWYPTLVFSIQSFKRYFSFGMSLLGSSLLNTIYGNINDLVIGKVFNPANLSFYNRAYGFANLFSATPTDMINNVMFPTLSKLQDDFVRLRVCYRKLIKLSSFMIFPICLGVGGIAYPMIEVILTNKWIFTASLLQIVVFSMMWYPIHAVNLNLLKVQGKGGLFFKLEIYKKIISIIILFASVPFGLKAMCYGAIASSILSLLLNTYYTGKFISLGILEQLKDLLPSLILSILMFVLVTFLCHLLGNTMLSMVTGIAVGAIFYLGVAWILRFEEIREVKLLFKKA